MIELHQYARAMGLPNASPFCMKVESWLRLKGLEYEIKPVQNPGKAPKGKAPFIVDAGERIGDSWFIFEHLRNKYGALETGPFSNEQSAVNYTTARMLEDHYYFLLLSERWLEPENAKIVKDEYFGFMPAMVRQVVFPLVLSSTKKQAIAQGAGRHSRQERKRQAEKAIEALSLILGEKTYFDGDQPGETDCTAVAFLANSIYPTFDSRPDEIVRSDSRLVGYTDRMMERVFPEFLEGLRIKSP